MLHPHEMMPGQRIVLPELGHLFGGDERFQVKSVHPGGMGVCVCLESQADGQRYALKSVRPDLVGNAAGLSRFLDELKVWLAASACSGVAEALAVISVNESPSVVARWADLGDLSSVMPGLSEAQKFRTVLRTVRTLKWAHASLGVVHRDLKPANILIDAEHLSFVSDWGLARPLRAVLRELPEAIGDHMERPDRTQAGLFLGTIHYSSPEQITDAASVDHRADIYSLGCIMYQLETGQLPFAGSTLREVARKHLEEPAPALGGFLRRTRLGLERVTARCLTKNPDDRFHSYEDLEKALLEVAAKRKYSLEGCEVTVRHLNQPLGSGPTLIGKAFEGRHNSKGYALVEFAELQPFLEEASALIALGRYSEAAGIFRPLYLPELLDAQSPWHVAHIAALDYALCLLRMGGHGQEALDIFDRLARSPSPPAELYVNHSLALLWTERWAEARAVCERGIERFAGDIDLLGNYTLALTHSGELDKAEVVARRRIRIRRDVHSIEELVGVLSAQREGKRSSSLPDATQIAREENSLIREGLALNPRFMPLVFARIRLLRFVKSSLALEACQALIGDAAAPEEARWRGLELFVSELTDTGEWQAALDLVDRHLPNCKIGHIKEALLFARWSTYADQKMIGLNAASGARVVIKEVVDFFLERDEGRRLYPLHAARVLEWLGKHSGAEVLLRGAADSSTDELGWKSLRELAFLYSRTNRPLEAVAASDELIGKYPWRAGSFDARAWVAKQQGDIPAQERATRTGNVVYQEEASLLKELRRVVV